MNQKIFEFTGNEKIVIKELFRTIRNSFTYELWIKPVSLHQIDPESVSGIFGIHGRSYVVSPENPGNQLKAGMGISVGINGVSVYEHSNYYFPALLVYQMEIKDWIHVVVVYNDKTPHLYINGELVKVGLKSPKNEIFPSGIFGAHDSYGSFKGQVKEIRLWDHVRTNEQIKENMNKTLMGNEAGLFGYWILNNRGKYKLMDQSIHQNHGVFGWLNYFQSVLNGENLSKLEEVENQSVVDIIIPLSNSPEKIIKCIEAVNRNSDHPYHLYLVHDSNISTSSILYVLSALINSIKPKFLQMVTVLKNRYTLTENHVILLENYVEVPEKWISRIMNPILQDELIGCVIPFSQKFCDFSLPQNVDSRLIDQVFNQFGTCIAIEIPIQVVGCIAFNRKALDQVKYIEANQKNDLCLRATEAEYKHVIISNLFIHDKGRIESFTENQKISIPDQLKPVTQILSSLLLAKNNYNKQGVLFVCNKLIGGTEYYQEKYSKETSQTSRVYRLRFESNKVYLEDHNFEYPHIFSFTFDGLNQQQFNLIVQLFGIHLFYINHLIRFPLFNMMDLIRNTQIDYVYYIHDYYSACPRFDLINRYGVYCGAETNLDVCKACLGSNSDYIESWRSQFNQFLLGAKRVYVPSKSTKDIIQKYYPDILIEVKEHTLSENIYHTYKEEFAYRDVINVAFIGNFYGTKGINVLYEIKTKIRDENLPIHITVIGFTNIHPSRYESEDKTFKVTGRYNNQEISNLLALQKVSLVIIPSICPETFSYTTSEAMVSGYPVITFNLGAPAERVRKTGGGWVVDSIDSESIMILLRRLVGDREEIVKKAKCLG
ncbi:glycosyltransferase [Peribacillus frigoritolerans]|uniref:glycosyltransferase n=1 Tax=Peribacillus frigoritolerans TaxID=450367 RepID=UPI0034E0676E